MPYNKLIEEKIDNLSDAGRKQKSGKCSGGYAIFFMETCVLESIRII
jgi:hypothetical protein